MPSVPSPASRGRAASACQPAPGVVWRVPRWPRSTSSVCRLPVVDAPHQQWTAFARLWAEWLVLRYSLLAGQITDMQGEPDRLHDLVEQRFADWLLGQYSGLHNLSYWPRPVMVHHIGRYMAHRAELALP